MVRCGCGHCFDPDKVDGVTQELEVISQEEQLYRDYLAARAAQAEDEARVAKTTAAREPDNTVRIAEALLATQTAMNARAELEAQDARTTAVKNRIKVVRSSRRRKAKTAAPVSRPTPVSVRETLAPPVPAAAPPPPLKAVAKPLTPTPMRPPVVVPTINPTPVSMTQVRQEPAPRPVPALVPNRNDTREPTPAFRSTQATKAEQITTAPPPPMTKPTGQDCPNCCGKVAPNTKRCRCGYELPSSANQMPALAMSPEDRDAMLAALGLSRDTGK